MAELPHIHRKVTPKGCRCFSPRGSDSFLNLCVPLHPVERTHAYTHRVLYLFQTVLFSLSFLKVDLETNFFSAQLFLRPRAIRNHRASASKYILGAYDNQRLIFHGYLLFFVEYTHVHRHTQFQSFFTELTVF